MNPDAVDIGSVNGQKGVCVSHLWTARPLGSSVSPNLARLFRDAKVMMARDRARQARQAKTKLTMAKAKAKAKAKVTSGNHNRADAMD